MDRPGMTTSGGKDAATAGTAVTCSVCHGHRLKPVVTSVVFFWTEIPTIIENVPALRCRDCGEQHLDLQVADRLDSLRMRAGKAVALRHVSVPVVDYGACTGD